MRILGPASAPLVTVQSNLQRLGADPRFRNEMFPHLWKMAEIHGIDPVGVVAQSYKETGGGTFRGQVRPQFYNTCGLKIRHQNLFPGITDGDNPLAHAMFPNWEVGAMAQCQHLWAYTGQPCDDVIVDPRFTYAQKTDPGTWVEDWADLGGKWAPSPTYGKEIETIMLQLRGTTV